MVTTGPEASTLHWNKGAYGTLTLKNHQQEHVVSAIGALYLGTLWYGGIGFGKIGLSLLPLWEVSDLLYSVIEHREGTWELVLGLRGQVG